MINMQVLRLAAKCISLLVFCMPAYADGTEGYKEEPVLPFSSTLPVTKFTGIEEHVGNLFRIKLTEDGHLALNREIMGTLNSTAAKDERMAELLKDVKKRLPYVEERVQREEALRLLNDEGAAASDSRLAVFKRFQSKVFNGGGWSGGGNPASNGKWDFDTDNIKGSLSIQNSSWTRVMLVDNSPAAIAPRTISVIDDGNGKFVLYVCLEARGPFLILSQEIDKRTELDLLAGGVMTSVHGASFSELVGREKKLFQEKVYPLLSHVGVRLPAAYSRIAE